MRKLMIMAALSALAAASAADAAVCKNAAGQWVVCQTPIGRYQQTTGSLDTSRRNGTQLHGFGMGSNTPYDGKSSGAKGGRSHSPFQVTGQSGKKTLVNPALLPHH
jgi:hypothetical protein